MAWKQSNRERYEFMSVTVWLRYGVSFCSMTNKNAIQSTLAEMKVKQKKKKKHYVNDQRQFASLWPLLPISVIIYVWCVFVYWESASWKHVNFQSYLPSKTMSGTNDAAPIVKWHSEMSSLNLIVPCPTSNSDVYVQKPNEFLVQFSCIIFFFEPNCNIVYDLRYTDEPES